MSDQLDDAPDVTLPTITNVPTSIAVPPLAPTSENESDAEINRKHLSLSNLEIQVIHSMWPQVKSIAGVCKLIDASIKAVKHQRDLLCLPYGYKGESQRKDVVFPPLED